MEQLDSHTTRKLQAFLNWIEVCGFMVIVWDMDCTMSAQHCGTGIPKDRLQDYISSTSKDFITVMNAIAEISETSPNNHISKVRFAVATGSDPIEYGMHGNTKETHILGPDLATAIINQYCPKTLPLFEIMVGYDCREHPEDQNETVNIEGKRHHMRLIQKHYNVPFEKMVLIDDSPSSLINEDGWIGVRVKGDVGFRFEDCVGTID